jgi:cytochrome b pre-mRNA-processing protein 3
MFGAQKGSENAMLFEKTKIIDVFRRLLGAGDDAQIIDAIYAKIVDQSRRPIFYDALAVPDTVDGRFDMIVLHSFLVIRRLKNVGAKGPALSQKLLDRFFADMDQSLREMGVGDLSVGKKVRKMAEAFYGRVDAYERGLTEPNDNDLATAAARNIYAGIEPTPIQTAMADYIRKTARAFENASDADILGARLAFADPF